MTDTSYLYEYFADKSPDDKTKEREKDKLGKAAQDKRKPKRTEDTKHV